MMKHRPRCLECQREFGRRHYRNNPEYYQLRNKDSQRKKKECIDRVKSVSSCIVCGYHRHPQVLEFHHINPSQKSFAISKYKKAPSVTAIELEIAKCAVLCANCHRVFHALYGQQPTAEDFDKFLEDECRSRNAA